jgi:preprotein translocase subunit SecG
MNISLIQIAQASGLDTFLQRINYYIVNPLIRILFALAVIYFIYGIVQYILNRSNAEEKERGRKHIMWGLIGLFIMTSVFFILRILVSTFGLDGVTVNESIGEIDIEIGDIETGN